MDSIEKTLKELTDGKPIIVADDESRENEGDIICAGEKITPEIVAFMARQACGLICLALTNEDCDRLALHPMVNQNTALHGTNFTVSIDAATGVSTGISAADRARTIQLASAAGTSPFDFSRPGHIFPLRAAEGGVCERAGHTEAAVDLARMAGLRPAAAICEIMNPDGSMARLPDLKRFASAHKISLISVSQVRELRFRAESLVEEVASSNVPTDSGTIRLSSFRMRYTNEEALALIVGDPESKDLPLVRVHSECITGEALGSLKCDCGYQLEKSVELMQREGAGVVVYLRQEGRGIGIHNKLRAYALQEHGLDTVDANLALGLPIDSRDYAFAVQILKALNLRAVRLITNNPLKIMGLRSYGIDVAETLQIASPLTKENEGYLSAKMERMGHMLQMCFR